jgi:hypothetical protein
MSSYTLLPLTAGLWITRLSGWLLVCFMFGSSIVGGHRAAETLVEARWCCSGGDDAITKVPSHPLQYTS